MKAALKLLKFGIALALIAVWYTVADEITGAVQVVLLFLIPEMTITGSFYTAWAGMLLCCAIAYELPTIAKWITLKDKEKKDESSSVLED